MKIIEEALNGILLIEPRVFSDDRGVFFESFNEETFERISGIRTNFLQDNHSVSRKNVIRGLHLQAPPFEQGKLVRVVRGAVLDVAVDIRKSSQTYGKYYMAALNEKNNYMMWIPPGFAHGFSVLENETVFLYKCTKGYSKESEMTVSYSDPEIGIDWKVINPIVSEKDKEGSLLSNFNSPF